MLDLALGPLAKPLGHLITGAMGKGAKNFAPALRQFAADESGAVATPNFGRWLSKAANLAKQDHHPIPKFLGGFDNQVMSTIGRGHHILFHSALNHAFKANGIPLRGNSSRAAWANYFNRNPGAQAKAFDTLLGVARHFDAALGSSLYDDVVTNIIGGSFRSFP